MPKIVLSKVQAGYMQATHVNASNARAKANEIDAEIRNLNRRMQELARDASNLREAAARSQVDALADVSVEHGVSVDVESAIVSLDSDPPTVSWSEAKRELAAVADDAALDAIAEQREPEEVAPF